MLNFLKAIPVVGSSVFIVAWIAFLIGLVMNLWKTGAGVIDLLQAQPVTTDMLLHVGIRALSLFIPIVNGIAGYF